VLQTGIHARGVETQVGSDHETQQGRHRQRRGAGPVVRDDPVGRSDQAEEDAADAEQPCFDLHQASPSFLVVVWVVCATGSSSLAANSGWWRSKAGDSERMRGRVWKF